MPESYATKFARLGGLSKSPAKAAAARRNGALGGRPKLSEVRREGSGLLFRARGGAGRLPRVPAMRRRRRKPGRS